MLANLAIGEFLGFVGPGIILIIDASCPNRCRIEFLSPEDPPLLYVRFTDGGGQLFDLEKVPSRAVKALGWLLTSKPVKSIGAEKSAGWSDRRFGRPRLPLGLEK